MKKFVSLLLAVLMTAALFTGCAKQPQAPDQPQEEAVTIRVGGLKGPTSMGLVKLLDDAENQKTANAIDFRMAASANELNPLFLKGELDIMAVPANLGSVLYNKTEGQVKMLAVSTLGVLYIVEKGGETVTDIKSLAGKTIYATGKGATPEYALTYLLAQNGLELGRDVNVEWKSEPTEIVAQMAAMDNAVAMLPQPFVVVARSQVDGLRVALDLTEEWDALDNGSALLTGVVVARADFVKEHPAAVSNFLEQYSASVDWVNANTADAAALIGEYSIVDAAVAEKALPYCQSHKLPIVVCTTGLSEELQLKVVQLSRSVPVFKSANMSMGINVLAELCKRASAVLGVNYDIEIVPCARSATRRRSASALCAAAASWATTRFCSVARTR